jgi:uncharacterized protein (TIGR03084 family)
MPDLAAILDDLQKEHRALDALVAPLTQSMWDSSTPAEGWSIQDQIGHLAFFDEQATMAMNDPDGFATNLQTIAQDIGAFMDRSIARGRELDGEGVLDWWRTARNEMLLGGRSIDPSARVPWYGPPMSPASFVSARQMETWAHGQDVADALAVERHNTGRIFNIAHIGVLSRKHSYANRGLPIPDEPVLVRLTSPEGETRTWGEGAESITGSAVDFCLVVTQRRHPDDTQLEISGAFAREWMSIAQAYAGPPGPGRKPGQFQAIDGEGIGR